ncbi:hypothetical protein PDE_01183 [Penicillium oxalicum 114-2]|uniref:Uncharacterized protein n=1 Tax=Penicillium oxalicum (strain 114-2 / CGMCC 5302) TaxID=933388 RepID=S8AWI8_PENO1|nr:hypothetical protein PDE_01183 [Penicillium oxalicum 114-2]
MGLREGPGGQQIPSRYQETGSTTSADFAEPVFDGHSQTPRWWRIQLRSKYELTVQSVNLSSCIIITLLYQLGLKTCLSFLG